MFSNPGRLAQLDTYDKVESYLVAKFDEWESELTEDKIYYDLILKLLQQGDVQYNTRTKKFKWSVPTNE